MLRTQGLQFVRIFQGALRLVSMYSSKHNSAQTQTQRAMVLLNDLLSELTTLSIGFQFDRVLINSLPVADPTLAWLAGELAKRRVGYLVFSFGMNMENLEAVLDLLSARPDTIEQDGGLEMFLRHHPMEHAQIVPVRLAADEGAMAVVTSAEEAALLSRIPRWLLRALQTVQSAEGDIIGAKELTALGVSLNPELTPEQRVLVPQFQDVLVRVVQKANTQALTELLEAATQEAGAAGEELLQQVMLQGLTATAELENLGQAERIMRVAPELRLQPESLLQMVPEEKIPPGVREGLKEYALWLGRPAEERLARLAGGGSEREYRWLALEVEHLCEKRKTREAAELLARLYEFRGPAADPDRATVLGRARELLGSICLAGIPQNAEAILAGITGRLQSETSPLVSAQLIEALATLAQTAAEREDFQVAISCASLVGEMADELSPRGSVARSTQAHLLRPQGVTKLIDKVLNAKTDPAVVRNITQLLKRTSDQAARELFGRLEKENVAARRMRILQAIKLLGTAACDAIAERVADPQWYVVRNAVYALSEIGDPALLARLDPALQHDDVRVQQAAVGAAIKTRLPERGPVLAGAIPHLKPSVLEGVLDDLLVLKEPSAIPHLERLLLEPGPEVKLHIQQKAIGVLLAIGNKEAVGVLSACLNQDAAPRALRQAALRALARIAQPAARAAVYAFGEKTKDAMLAEEARKLLST